MLYDYQKYTDMCIIIKQKIARNGAHGIAIGAGGGIGGQKLQQRLQKTNLKASLDTKISKLH